MWTRKKSFHRLSLKDEICVFLPTFSSFLFKFISPAYKHPFISLNHVICNTGYLRQTDKEYGSYLDLKYVFFSFFNMQEN